MGLVSTQVLDIILEWVRYDIPNRECQFKEVVKYVDCKIDAQYLSQLLETEQLFASSEICLYILLKHFYDHGITFERHGKIYEEMNKKYSVLVFPQKTVDSAVGEIQKLEVNEMYLNNLT